MKWILILGVLVFTFKIILSQSYCTIHTNGVAHFENPATGLVYTVTPDSQSVLGDTLAIYNYRMIRQDLIDPNVYHFNGDSWSGKKTDILINGMELYYNKYSDTIFIQTQATLGNSWRFYNYSNGNYVDAMVSSVAYSSILSGLNDTIKTITLQVRASSGQAVSSNINSHYLLLSKSYGFIKTFNFYEFPDYNVVDNYHENVSELELIGLENPDIGWQNFDAAEVFDFELGDEFHIRDAYTSQGSWTDTEMIKKVIGKTTSLSGDTINYTFDICEEVSSQQGSYTNGFYDEELIVLNEKEYMGKHSFEIYESNSIDILLKYNDTIKVLHDKYTLTGVNDTLFFSTYPGNPSRFYKIGLGQVYSSQSNPMVYSKWSELKYYKKGNNIWGIPYSINCTSSNVNTNIVLQSVRVDPNPVSDVLLIESPDRINKIYVFNNLGALVGKFNGSQDHISTSNLLKGIYYLRIETEKGPYHTKFIKQ